MKTKGNFIVIEGIDGCGKSTQVSMLEDQIKSECHFTREATDSPIGKLIREAYLSGQRKCDERIINLLYAADRLDHVTNSEDGILKYLDQGINVISDRYYLSSMAYNSYMMPTDDEIDKMIEYTINLNRYNMELVKPDLTIYIELDPLEALRRINGGRDDVSVYENTTKLVKIHETYNRAINILRTKFNEKIVIVDANNLTPTELNGLIYELVCRYIAE